MDISTIVNFAFIAVLIIAFCAIIRWDMYMLQQKEFDTEIYYDWVRGSDETYSTKRCILMAVFLGSTTNFAATSWMVMVIFTAAILLLDIYLIRKIFREPLKVSKRIIFTYLVILLATICIVTTLVVTSKTLEQKTRDIIYSVLFFTSFSYALSLASNWFVNLLMKKDSK